jgi:hypothetical protein
VDVRRRDRWRPAKRRRAYNLSLMGMKGPPLFEIRARGVRQRS